MYHKVPVRASSLRQSVLGIAEHEAVYDCPCGGAVVVITGGSRGLGLMLAREFAARGTRSVTTVCPGLMRTGSARNARFKAQNRAEYGWFSLGAAGAALPTLAALSLAAKLMPKEGGIGRESARGYESTSAMTESFLTTLSKRAEVELHQR